MHSYEKGKVFLRVHQPRPKAACRLTTRADEAGIGRKFITQVENLFPFFLHPFLVFLVRAEHLVYLMDIL